MKYQIFNASIALRPHRIECRVQAHKLKFVSIQDFSIRIHIGKKTLASCCVAGFVRALVVELWSVLECGSEDVRVVRPKPTPMDPIDRSCLKVLN